MASKNDITGDVIKSRVNNKQFEDNFDNIFRKDKDPVQLELDFGEELACDICGKPLDPNIECAWTGCPLNWNESRVDVIGQNGPTGDHYEEQK
jgi:hypothetical protein